MSKAGDVFRSRLEKWKVSLLEDEMARVHFESWRLHRKMNGIEDEFLSPEETMDLLNSLIGDDDES